MGRQFNGTTQRAISTSVVDLTGVNTVSVAFWLWWDAFADDDDLALEFTPNSNSPETGGFYFDPNASDAGGGQMVLFLRGNVGINAAIYARPSAAAWHHYVLIMDKSQATNEVDLYIDGTLQTPNSRPNISNNTNNFASSTLSLMARSAAGGSLFGAGRLAEVGLWNVRLTGTNATNLAAGALPSSIPTGLLHYWKLCGVDSPEGDSADAITATLTASPPQVDHPSAVSGSCGSASTLMGAICM